MWHEAVPVCHDGRVVAVLGRHAHVVSVRPESPLEVAYRRAADALLLMVAQGGYPDSGAPTGQRRGAPRVGDGLMHLDADGRVLFASPNALSNYHRLGLAGDLEGELLAEVTAGLLDGPDLVDETLPLVVTGRAPWRTEVQARGVALSLRAIPLRRRRRARRRAGAVP